MGMGFDRLRMTQHGLRIASRICYLR